MAAMHVFRFLGLVVLARARALMSSASAISSHPLAEVYVINLDNRTDKCRCMQHQLRHMPWPVHRFRALNRETVLGHCPTLVSSEDKPQKKANAALVCSNKMIWQRFLTQSHAENLVIFEDDAAMLDDAIWKKLGHFLENPCTEWDYLLVDPWANKWNNGTACGDFELFDLDYGKSGSHLQVFSRRIIKPLIEFASIDHGFVPVADKLFEVFRHHSKHEVRPFAVRANIVAQAAAFKHLTGREFDCEASVATQEDRMQRLDALHPSSVEDEVPPFEC